MDFLPPMSTVEKIDEFKWRRTLGFCIIFL
jgi:hypothetical protein